ncbi:hypothetical protein ACFOVU_14605 [Nocardiopsis sediminis]|uniref:Integral membrane protein n=1 Tax=Nocardiopsis sediminis TaxID=1778267 RepID=A0ABV8FLX3_9ACTN
MSASSSIPPVPGEPPEGHAVRRIAVTERGVAIAANVVLLSAGFAAGIVGGPAARWLTWLWNTGLGGQVVAGAIAVAVLVLLFTACRVAGWGTGSRLGAGLPAVGWTAASFALVTLSSGGDIMLTANVMEQVYLFGGVFAVSMATVLTPPGP